MVSPDSRTRLGDLQGSLLYVTVFTEASCILLSIIRREHLVLFMFVLLFCDVMLGTLMKIDGICICDYFTCLLWYYFTCLLWYYFTCLLWYCFTCLLYLDDYSVSGYKMDIQMYQLKSEWQRKRLRSSIISTKSKQSLFNFRLAVVSHSLEEMFIVQVYCHC